MNYIDLSVIIVIAYYLFQGRKSGFVHLSFELLSMTVSLLFALLLYAPIGRLISVLLKFFQIALSPVWANPLGFFITWFLVESVFFALAHLLLKKMQANTFIGSKKDLAFSAVPAILKGLIFGAIFLSLFVSLPVQGSIKNDIVKSKIGGPLVRATDKLNSIFDNIFGGAIRQSLNFVTIKPGSEEVYDLGFKTEEFRPDLDAETRMLQLVNEERAKVGLKPLVMDERLRQLARTHSANMFREGYFSHTGKEGKGPCDRMDDAKIKYQYCGENLAYAPDVELAHRGLMNSPGHRANILNANYSTVGIGILNADNYGEMFSQEFIGF